jgi:hypothetical protein
MLSTEMRSIAPAASRTQATHLGTGRTAGCSSSSRPTDRGEDERLAQQRLQRREPFARAGWLTGDSSMRSPTPWKRRSRSSRCLGVGPRLEPPSGSEQSDAVMVKPPRKCRNTRAGQRPRAWELCLPTGMPPGTSHSHDVRCSRPFRLRSKHFSMNRGPSGDLPQQCALECQQPIGL